MQFADFQRVGSVWCYFSRSFKFILPVSPSVHSPISADRGTTAAVAAEYNKLRSFLVVVVQFARRFSFTLSIYRPAHREHSYRTSERPSQPPTVTLLLLPNDSATIHHHHICFCRCHWGVTDRTKFILPNEQCSSRTSPPALHLPTLPRTVFGKYEIRFNNVISELDIPEQNVVIMFSLDDTDVGHGRRIALGDFVRFNRQVLSTLAPYRTPDQCKIFMKLEL